MFESPLEQFLLKTKSVPWNVDMKGKILEWLENSGRGNRKTAGKNSGMVGNFPLGKNVFRFMEHLVLRYTWYRKEFLFTFLSVYGIS